MAVTGISTVVNIERGGPVLQVSTSTGRGSRAISLILYERLSLGYNKPVRWRRSAILFGTKMPFWRRHPTPTTRYGALARTHPACRSDPGRDDSPGSFSRPSGSRALDVRFTSIK